METIPQTFKISLGWQNYSHRHHMASFLISSDTLAYLKTAVFPSNWRKILKNKLKHTIWNHYINKWRQKKCNKKYTTVNTEKHNSTQVGLWTLPSVRVWPEGFINITNASSLAKQWKNIPLCAESISGFTFPQETYGHEVGGHINAI